METNEQTIANGTNSANTIIYNPVKIVSEHLFNDDKYTPIHRIACGVCFIVIGVEIAQVSAGTIYHFVGDATGYLIHGIGSLPILERLEKWIKS
jgi:hypothetical protein